MLQDKEFHDKDDSVVNEYVQTVKSSVIRYKVLDDGKSDPKVDKSEKNTPAIVEILPFSEGQAKWVQSLLNEYLNLKKCVDIV
jgi:hypothetical protein